MTEKVKITQEQADAIEKYKSNGHKLKEFVVHGERGFHGYYEPLKGLPIDDMARLLYEADSYEIEPEPLKVGDWIVRLDGTTFMNDKYVVQVDKVCDIHLFYDRDIGIDKIRIRHATPEEIKVEKECRLWKSIGREVGEFRDGDLGEHVSGVEHSESREYLSDWYKRERLKGFYPAESFISFEEVEPNE